jgi:hypothetical protein
MESLPDLLKQFAKIQTRRRQALEALIPLAKAAVPVLKDANQPSTAREIEAQLFVIKSLEEEAAAIVMREPKSFIDGLLAGERGR